MRSSRRTQPQLTVRPGAGCPPGPGTAPHSRTDTARLHLRWTPRASISARTVKRPNRWPVRSSGTRVGRQPQLFTRRSAAPCGAWCCLGRSPPAEPYPLPTLPLGQHPPPPGGWKRCPVRSWRWAAWAWFLVWVTSWRRQPQLWVIPRRRLVPRVVILPALAGAAVPGFPPRHTGRAPSTCSTTVQSTKGLSPPWELWPWSLRLPSLPWQTPVPVKANPGPCLRNKKSWNLLGYKGFQDF